MDNHIVVVGLGNAGYRIVDNLLDMGEKVIVILLFCQSSTRK